MAGHDGWKTQPRVPSGNTEGGQWTSKNDAVLLDSAAKAAGVKKSYVTPYHVAYGNLASLIENDSFSPVDPEDEDDLEGAYESYRVELEFGERAQVKPNFSDDRLKDLSIREAVAYNISEELGLGIVPETIYDEYYESSFQFFVDNAEVGAYSYDDITDIESLSKMQMLDIIIANSDRHSFNWLVKDGQVVAIDHGLSMQNNPGLREPFSVIEYSRHNIIELLAARSDEEWIDKFYDTQTMPLDDKYRDNLRSWIDNGFPGVHGISGDRRQELIERAEYLWFDWDDVFHHPGN